MLQAPSPTNATVSPASVPLCSLDGQQVGEQLAGVEVVGEGVDDRDAGVLGHLLDPVLGVGAPHDHRGLPAEHPGDVGDRLAHADAGERAVDEHRVPPSSAMPAANDAWVRSVGLSKIIATVCGPGERLRVVRRPLELGGQVEHRGLLGGGEVVVGEEVAGHGSGLLGASSRMPGQAARNASTSSSVSTSGGASRIRSGVGLLTMKPASSAAAATSADDVGRTGRGRSAARARAPR